MNLLGFIFLDNHLKNTFKSLKPYLIAFIVTKKLIFLKFYNKSIFLPESLARPINAGADGPDLCTGLFALTICLRFSSIVYVFMHASNRHALQRGEVFNAHDPV